MRYGSGLLEEILRRTDLVQLVGRRVKLVRKGRVMWGCCPFHQEKTPSFKVENERRAYHCFGCGAGGDAFKWLMETEGLSFPEAVERLAGEAGVELPKWSPEDEAREQKKKSLYDIIELACAFYEAQLREPVGRAAREYLKSRGIDDAAAKKFRLGYAPSGNSLIEHLKTKNVTTDDMIEAGLARPADETRGLRDFFYSRVTFAITDPRGRVVAFGARALEADAKPKYINSPDTTLFSKGHLLYNFAIARPAGLKAQTIVATEGYMDVIALVRAGFDYAVAPLGTALTEDQLELLWRVAPEPTLCFDGDDAGSRAAARAARLSLPALKPGYSLRFAFLPPGEDPDSFIAKSGIAAMRQVLDSAEPLAKMLWRIETEGKDFTTPERRAGLERALAAHVGEIRDRQIAGYYAREFDQLVFDTFKRRAPKTPASAGGRPFRERGPYPVRPAQTVSPAVKNSLLARTGRMGAVSVKEMELSRLHFHHPQIALDHTEILASLRFSDPSLDRLRQELLNLAASGFSLEMRGLKDHLVRLGLAELAENLARRGGDIAGAENPSSDAGESADGEDVEARWLKAAQQLREMAELGPERIRAMERFKSEATEESWREAHRLLGSRLPND